MMKKMMMMFNRRRLREREKMMKINIIENNHKLKTI